IDCCSGVSDASLERLAREATKLKVLGMGWSGFFNASLLVVIAPGTQLTSLLYTGPVTDETLIRIAEHCGPQLRHLALTNVQCASDEGVNAMTRCCTNIESLH